MPTYSNITGTPTNSVNYVTYDIGARVINNSGADVVMTALSRWKRSGNSRVHNMLLLDNSGVELRTAAVDLSTGSANDFVHGAITDYTLPAGASCYILSPEVASQDSWWAQQGITNSTPFGTMYIGQRQGGVLSSQYPNGASQSFGPVSFQYSSPLATFSKLGNVYTTDGSFFDVNSALQDAVSGDIVNIPAGTPDDWFQGAAKMYVPAGVTLAGAGIDETIINMSTTADSGSYSSWSIMLGEGAIVRDFTLNGPDVTNAVPFITKSGVGTWEVARIKYVQVTGRLSYFINVQNAPSGWIHHCDITGGSGSSELVYVRGPVNAWQTDAGLGDANAVHLENCTFRGSGYVSDANDNARLVCRFLTITGQIKIDGHGRASNSLRGVRRLEVYHNRWTNTSGSWTAIEPRGGQIEIFRNVSDAPAASTGTAAFQVREYGCQAMFGGFQFRFQTPYNYPVLDQVGTGIDTTVAATSLGAGRFVKIATVGTTDYTLVGASANTVGLWFFLTGTPTGDGTLTTNSIARSYIYDNKKSGSQWVRSTPPLPAGGTYTTDTAGYAIGATSIVFSTVSTNTYAGNTIVFAGDTGRYLITNTVSFGSNRTITIAAPGLLKAIVGATSATVTANGQYQRQLDETSTTFGEEDVVVDGRDIMSDAGFDSVTGCYVGTAAQMAALSPIGKLGHGFFVTDEGDWNTENDTPGTPGYQKGHGQRYVSDDSEWILAYTPGIYPYNADPVVITPVPTLAEIDVTGLQLGIAFSIACTTGAGGAGGIVVTASGGAVTWTYASGSGSTTYIGTLSRPIRIGEIVTLSYTQPGSGIESTDDQVDVASFSGFAVTNNSQSVTTLTITTLTCTTLHLG